MPKETKTPLDITDPDELEAPPETEVSPEGDEDADETELEPATETQDEPTPDEPDEDNPKPDHVGLYDKTAKVVATLKESDEDIEEARARVKYFREVSRAGKGELFEHLPTFDYLTHAGRKVDIYAMTEDQFDSFLDAVEASDNAPKTLSRELVRARERFRTLYEVANRQADASELEIDNKEWVNLEAELLQAVPELKPYIQKIADWLSETLKKDGFARTRAQTLKGKAELVKKAIRILGIDKDINDKTKPSTVNTPGMHAVKQGGSPRNAKEKSFTRAQIAKMSMDDFLKYEKDIDAAARKNKIRS